MINRLCIVVVAACIVGVMVFLVSTAIDNDARKVASRADYYEDKRNLSPSAHVWIRKCTLARGLHACTSDAVDMSHAGMFKP